MKVKKTTKQLGAAFLTAAVVLSSALPAAVSAEENPQTKAGAGEWKFDFNIEGSETAEGWTESRSIRKAAHPLQGIPIPKIRDMGSWILARQWKEGQSLWEITRNFQSRRKCTQILRS